MIPPPNVFARHAHAFAPYAHALAAHIRALAVLAHALTAGARGTFRFLAGCHRGMMGGMAVVRVATCQFPVSADIRRNLGRIVRQLRAATHRVLGVARELRLWVILGSAHQLGAGEQTAQQPVRHQRNPVTSSSATTSVSARVTRMGAPATSRTTARETTPARGRSTGSVAGR
nr:hypothetical protein [Amycolatopsis aidingensis]